MKKKVLKQFAIFRIASIVVGMAVLLLTLPSCGGKNTSAKTESLGTPEANNKEFYDTTKTVAEKFNVFIESSASMDGYVNGNTEFKTCLHRLIGDIKADVLENDSNISLNYINSKIIHIKESTKTFTDAMSPKSFSEAGGDRANSDIIDIIENVVKNTSQKEISMFVSDCVYSPQSADDIDKALDKQQTDMKNILKNKVKSTPNFGVLIYRFVSNFDGIYYTKTNTHININNNQRPYFVWFFGEKSILAKVSENISHIVTENKAQSVIGISGYPYIPYKTLNSAPYHFTSAKTNEKGEYIFSFVADMNCLPLGKEYIENINNYQCGKTNYYIKKIEKYSNEPYNYKYTVCVKGPKNDFLRQTTVEISLKSMLSEIPDWIKKYDDPSGEDYNYGYNPKKLRTFGINSLIEGVKDFYNSSDYVTFQIKIN